MDNLPSIVSTGGLLSDSLVIARRISPVGIGMSKLKATRLTLPINCHPGTFVGDYVPFYFCPRSVMLFIIHKGNHPGLSYQEGQKPIVHLECDVKQVVAWAEARPKPWAFTCSNAASVWTPHHTGLDNLGEINWEAVNARFWRGEAEEWKQAELLVHRGVPWYLVRRIGVLDHATRARVLDALGDAAHRPVVAIKRDWYY